MALAELPCAKPIWGLLFERFDSLGRSRERYRRAAESSASGKLNDGTEISEFEGLNDYLSKN